LSGTSDAVSSWINQASDLVEGQPDESVGKIPEVCRRMPGDGEIRAVPREQSYMGSLGGEMDAVRPIG
jgi:hypothetical protein